MCDDCYEEYGSPTLDTVRIRATSELIRELYAMSCVGGNLHIVLDDWNLSDHSIQWCLDEAIPGNLHCADSETLTMERACAYLMLTMSEQERASALHLSGE